MNVFIGHSAFVNDKWIPIPNLHKHTVSNFQEFCNKFLRVCKKGRKIDDYITIGSSYTITKGDPNEFPNNYKFKDHYHRNNASQTSAWLLPFDGDSSKTNKDSCIPPLQAHLALAKLGYNHAVYTTHSHVKDKKNRWRIFIPCQMTHLSQLQSSVNRLFTELVSAGCSNLEMSTESKTWSTPWYLPTRDHPEDGQYEYYSYFDGRDFIPVESTGEISTTNIVKQSEHDRTINDMIKIVQDGISQTGLHAATRDLAYGFIKDGLSPAISKAILRSLMQNYNMSDPRQKENFNKIDALVDSSVKKVKEIPLEIASEWSENLEKKKNKKDTSTDYPNQGGVFEELVQFCMKWQRYPHRAIAVVSCHALISCLGGRVYTYKNENGIIYNAVLTGPSTIGKGSIKDFCIFMLNNFDIMKVKKESGEEHIIPNPHAHEFLGKHSYGSAKQLVDDVIECSGSVLSIFTESGHSDKSTAGDPSNVRKYELELATSHGQVGNILSKGQNEKVPALYSPAATIVRESVYEIQNEADILNQSSISGAEGRRSRIVLSPVRDNENRNRLFEIPDEIKKLIRNLYNKASNEKRQVVTEMYPSDLWTYIEIEDQDRLFEFSDIWNKKREEAYIKYKDHYESTFYGRLKERTLTYAARLAICENPNKPIVTNRIVDIAVESLINESKTFGKLKSESLTPWDDMVESVVEFFTGDMTKKNKTITTMHKNNPKILKMGACKYSALKAGVLKRSDNYNMLQKDHGNRFEQLLFKKLEYEGIYTYSKEDMYKLFKSRKGVILYRV